MVDGLIGAGTGGLLHGAGKLASEASPFVERAFEKVTSKISASVKEELNNLVEGLDNTLNKAYRGIDKARYNLKGFDYRALWKGKKI